MKTKKKPVEKACFLSRLISLVFPGCTASGWRCSTAQPVGGCATPNSQSFIRSFAKGFLRGASGASSSQSFNRSFAKICVRDAPFHRETVCVKQIAISGNGSRALPWCPWGGAGVKPRMAPFSACKAQIRPPARPGCAPGTDCPSSGKDRASHRQDPCQTGARRSNPGCTPYRWAEWHGRPDE